MKRAKGFFICGVVGLAVSLTIFLVGGLSYNPIPYILPWIVFLIIGVSIRSKHVKK